MPKSVPKSMPIIIEVKNPKSIQLDGTSFNFRSGSDWAGSKSPLNSEINKPEKDKNNHL